MYNYLHDHRDLELFDVRRLFFEHTVQPKLWPLSAATLSVALIALAAEWFGFPVRYRLYSTPLIMMSMVVLTVSLAAICLWILWRDKPNRPSRHLMHKLISEWRILERSSRGLPVLVAFSIFFSAFTSYKSALPQIMHIYFDPFARSIDQLLHGKDAWLMLAPLTK